MEQSPELSRNQDDEIITTHNTITIFGVSEKNKVYVEKIFHDFQPIYYSANYGISGEEGGTSRWKKSLDWKIISPDKQSQKKSKDKQNNFTNPNLTSTSVNSQQIEGSAFYNGVFEEQQSDSSFENNTNNNNFNDDDDEANQQLDNLSSAYSNSFGNWVYAKFENDQMNQIVNTHSKFVLENGDIVYCMLGRYQIDDTISEFPTEEEKKKMKAEKIEPAIFKVPPKDQNLITLPFEKKSFDIKFHEFIMGQSVVLRTPEEKKEDDEVSKRPKTIGEWMTTFIDNFGIWGILLIVALVIFFTIFIYKIMH